MNAPRVVALIQARMTSRRLPGKVLAEIGGRPALHLMIDRVRHATRVDAILVATTINTSDHPIVDLCRELSIETYRGDENDVLGRMYDAAKVAHADIVVRLTADCPMVDPALIDQAIDVMSSGEYDYVSNCTTRTYPDGLDVEVLTIDALETAHRDALDLELREHMTLYINGNRRHLPHGSFRIGEFRFEADFGHLRWTLDTKEDLDRIRALVAVLPNRFGWLEALSAASRDPWMLGVTENDAQQETLAQ